MVFITIWNLLGKIQPAPSDFLRSAEKTHHPAFCTTLRALSLCSPCCPLPASSLMAGLPRQPEWTQSWTMSQLTNCIRKWFRIENSWDGFILGIYILSEIAIVNVKSFLIVQYHNSEIDWWGKSFELEKYCLVSLKFH